MALGVSLEHCEGEEPRQRWTKYCVWKNLQFKHELYHAKTSRMKKHSAKSYNLLAFQVKQTSQRNEAILMFC